MGTGGQGKRGGGERMERRRELGLRARGACERTEARLATVDMTEDAHIDVQYPFIIVHNVRCVRFS